MKKLMNITLLVTPEVDVRLKSFELDYPNFVEECSVSVGITSFDIESVISCINDTKVLDISTTTSLSGDVTMRVTITYDKYMLEQPSCAHSLVSGIAHSSSGGLILFFFWTILDNGNDLTVEVINVH